MDFFPIKQKVQPRGMTSALTLWIMKFNRFHEFHKMVMTAEVTNSYMMQYYTCSENSSRTSSCEAPADINETPK